MKPPESICILRLSALGDVTHVLPIIHTLQKSWPETRLTWIIGSSEYQLVGDLPNVEFIVFDKGKRLGSYAKLWKSLRHRAFDILLGLQVAFRANLIYPLIIAKRKIGYDKARSKDGHGCFVNERIPQQSGQHVVDSFFSFLETIGLSDRVYDWSLPLPESAETFAESHVGSQDSFVAISPCSSNPLRDWKADRYARIADYVMQNLGQNVALCGGPSEAEAAMGKEIENATKTSPLNLIGKTSLKDNLAVLRRATLLISPDSGPAHMATCVDTPVIGLYATSNPGRTGPYRSIDLCVDAYDQASRKYLDKPASKIKWGKRLVYPGVMDLITPDDVIGKLDRFFKIEEKSG